MSDTIMRVQPEVVPVHEVLLDALWRAICRRWGHRWKLYRGGDTFRHGRREVCDRCTSNRVVFHDGSQVVASAVEIRQADPVFGEALYEARWGEQPRRKFGPGDWPAP